MTTDNRRRADRIEVDFSAKLMTHGNSADATLRDLSRTGIRLRLEASQFGLEIPEHLSDLERSLRRILPDPVFITLDHQRLGPLVRRLARMERLGVPADQPAAIDLCCAFSEPLTDDEAQVLGLPLPPLKETVEEWREVGRDPTGEHAIASCPSKQPASDPARRADAEASGQPRHRYRISVSSTSRRAPPAIFCYTDLLTGIGVRIRVPRDQLGGSKDAASYRASDVCKLLVKRFGREVQVRIHDGDEDLWSGPMHVNGAELPPNDASQILISLGFARRLKLSEMRRLGLVASAA